MVRQSLRLVAAVLMLVLALSQASAQPRLTIPEGKRFSLGEIYRGAVVDHDLLIRNTGTDTLVIEAVHASCGCTGTMVSKNRIAPNENGIVRVTFNSKNFSGSVHKSLSIVNNTPGESSVLVEFDATVVEEVVVDPQQFWFQDAMVGKTSSMSITVKNEGKAPFSVKGFRSGLKGLSVVLPGKPIQPGQSAKLVANFLPVQAVPVLVEWVFIDTDNPRQSQISLPVYGNVTSAKGN